MEKITILNNPLINHKLTFLRDKNTSSRDFKRTVEEITALMMYKVFENVQGEPKEIETPLCKMQGETLKKGVTFIPVLRAGLAMAEGAVSVVPDAKIGHVGMVRNEETLEPTEYYFKLPEGVQNDTVIILDPMLATGGSAAAAVSAVKKRGITNIKFVSIVSAPQGIEKLSKEHPDIEIYCGAEDSGLNERGYIVPGLGDAGDRIFGTK